MDTASAARGVKKRQARAELFFFVFSAAVSSLICYNYVEQ